MSASADTTVLTKSDLITSNASEFQSSPASSSKISDQIQIPVWLPANATEILHKYRAIDKLYCMLSHRKMTLTLESFRNYDICDENALSVILRIAPKSVFIKPLAGSLIPSLQFYPGGASEARSEARTRSVLTAIIEETKRQFFAATCISHQESKREKSCREKMEWKKILTCGLPSDFKFIYPTSKLPLFSIGKSESIDTFSKLFQKEDKSIAPRSLCELELPDLVLQNTPTEISLPCLSPAMRVLTRMQMLPFYNNQFIHHTVIASREARFQALNVSIDSALSDALVENINIDVRSGLFRHQALAIDALRSGRHLAIATETSSGKSLCYNIPVMEACMRQPSTTALYLFPTKALAQDQLRATNVLCGYPGFKNNIIRAGIIDGDSPHDMRSFIASGPSAGGPHIILTNPDFLHHTLLAKHSQYESIFKGLRYVVIDEAHNYRGTFGAHVAWVLRRLLRVCFFYSKRSPQFITCSATISNPKELFSQLLPLNSLILGGESNLSVVNATESGNARGERLFALWNSPFVSPSSPDPVHDNQKPPKKRRNMKTDENENDKSAALIALANEYTECKDSMDNVEEGSTTPKTDNLHSFRPGRGDPHRMHLGSVYDHDLATEEFLWSCEDRHRLPVSWKGLHGELRRRGVRQSEQVQVPTIQDVSIIKNTQLIKRKIPDIKKKERESPIIEIARLLAYCVRLRLRTLCFCGTRKLVELVNRMAQEELRTTYDAEHLISCVSSYRGGYTATERRKIEDGLFNGRLIGVVATCALELGVDVGSLDVTLQLGFPGSMSSMWQQIGRAGRGGRPSLSILLLWNSPVDQYFARNPEKMLTSAVEEVVLGVNNPHIVRGHLLCAAHELPLNALAIDQELWSHSFSALGKELLGFGYLALAEDQSFKYVSAPDKDGITFDHPAKTVNLRLIDPVTIDICDETRNMLVIDSMPYSRAFFEAFEGSIFYFKAQQFIITKLDLSQHRAMCRSARVSYSTSALNDIIITIIRRIAGHDEMLSFGTIRVVHKVNGFLKRSLVTREILEECEFKLPPLEMETQAMWIDIPMVVLKRVESSGFCITAALHAANHTLMTMAAVSSDYCSDAIDIDCEHFGEFSAYCHNYRLLLYDKRPGGLGICERLFESGWTSILRALEALRSCGCTESNEYEDGCPACLLDSRCSQYNENLSKLGAICLFESLLAVSQNFVHRDSGNSTSSSYNVAQIPREEGGFFHQMHQSSRDERRQMLLTNATYRDTMKSRGIFVSKPWGKIPIYTSGEA